MPIRNTFLLALLVLAGGLYERPAWASGDFTCYPAWTLAGAVRSDCDNQPFLSPGNDSRVNLQLLLIDAGLARLHPPKPPKEPPAQPSPDASPPIWTSASPFTLEDFTSLLADDSAAPSDDTSNQAEGAASRCDTNSGGADQFKAALDDARGLPLPEKTALAAARAALNPNCEDASKAVAPAPTVPIRSATGKLFAAYLTGATAFYAGDYDLARQSFASAQASGQPWLRETARYMLGRTELNRAQEGAFDQYGVLQLDKADAKAAAAAGAAFQAYLRDYPAGLYAASARGLLRRAAWLGGEPQMMAANFTQAFALTSPDARNVSEIQLVQEADSKLLDGALAAQVREPTLLAVYDLMQMRKGGGDAGSKPIALAALEAQRPVFAGHEALFDYLLAAQAFYDDQDPATALRLLPAAAPGASMSYLDYSRQVLRGLALDAAKDNAGARALWLQLLSTANAPLQHGTLQVALAMNYERGDALAQVFAAGSPIQDPDVRAIVLRHAAGPALLRARAKAADAPAAERRMALATLLYKEVTRGRYQAFLDDLALMPPPPAKTEDPNQPSASDDFVAFRWAGGVDEDSYPCPSLRDIARTLARDPHNAHGLLCLSEFVRRNGLDDDNRDVRPPADELGGAPSQFPGAGYSRLESYQQILANPKAGPNERAYTLYRAVRCYASSGYNHCTGPGVPQTQRKAWFRLLKTTYASSVWAQNLQYYW